MKDKYGSICERERLNLNDEEYYQFPSSIAEQ